MGKRERLLAQVQARLERFGADHNPATVLDPEAVAELTALLETVPDPTADLEIAYAAGWLHWCRYLCRYLVPDAGDDRQDLAEALALFAPVYQTRPGAVPDQVRTHFGRLAAADHSQALADRAITLLRETLRTGDRAALDAAIDLFRQAVAASPADDPGRAAYLVNLCTALRTRSERTGDRADLDAAIDAGWQAVAASPADDPDRTASLASLGAALEIRSQQGGDRADMDTAIDLLRQAVAASPADDPGRARYLSTLGAALWTRSERTGDRADLDAAIDAGWQAVAASPADDPDRAAYLTNLALALRTRSERTGDRADLDAAIDAGRQAVAASPADHLGLAAHLDNLALALQTRSERTGDRADLDAAIDLLRQAVAANPADHLALARHLDNLGAALGTRFERIGDLADLDAAIDLFRQAVAAGPAGHPGRARYLANLGAVLRMRSERTGDLADLDAAIDLSRQAVAASPADDPDRARCLTNLGNALRSRSERTRDLADLDAAIDLLRQAVAASRADHPDRAAYLVSLGLAQADRSERTGDLADLDAAIDLLRQAVAASPAGDPGRAGYLSDLGNALRLRSERTGDLADLDAAIDLLRQGMAAAPAGHPGRARYLSDLGAALGSRFGRARDLADLDAAIDAGQQAAAVEVASPHIRALAARRWGRAAAVGQRWQEAVAGFAAAAELLGLVAPRSLIRGDQEFLLQELGGVGAEAAACCVHAGLTGRAVELFEQGRGVLLGQALDTRTDLTALAEQHPGLADRFTVLRDDLDRAGDPAVPPAPLPPGTEGAAEGRAEAARRDMERRRAAAAAFDQVIGEIRRLPDFRGFLRPPRTVELLAAAAEGPVVVVTVSPSGSHALILAGGVVLDPVPLAGLTPETVYDRVVAFIGALDDAWSPAAGDGGRAAAEQQLRDTLGWLWETLAGPVLDRLGITGPPRDGQPWPRLWWCVSGLLSFLPVHAAGHHRTWADAAPATVIDRVISSYTPTLRALIHARRCGATTDGDGGAGPVPGTGWWRWRCRTPRTLRIFPVLWRRPPGSGGVSLAGSPCSPGRTPLMTRCWRHCRPGGGRISPATGPATLAIRRPAACCSPTTGGGR